jgi:hypothetical protein
VFPVAHLMARFPLRDACGCSSSPTAIGVRM